MTTTPGASRPTRIQPKQGAKPSAPARPKMASPRPSATQHKSSSSVKKSTKPSSSSQPKRTQQRAQPSRSAHKSGSSSSKRSQAKAVAGRILHSTPSKSLRFSSFGHSCNPYYALVEHHSSRSAQKVQHVHRHTTGGKNGSSSRPVYVVCDRKHYDNGLYARCQRVLRRFVKWDR